MKGIIYIILGACSYGVLSTFVKLAYKDGFIVNDVVGIQMFIGALLLWGGVLLGSKKRTITHKYLKPNKKEILLLTVVGSTTGLTGMFYYLALQYISASLAIVLLFQFTWMGVLIEALINRKIPGKGKILSLIPLFIGTLSATNIFTTGLSSVHWLGFLYGFLAAVSYTIFILLSGKVAVQANPVTKTALMISGGFVICALILPPTFFTNGKLLIELALKFGFALAFFGPFFSTLMFSKGVPLIGAGLASILGAMELPTAILMSAVVLKEHVGTSQYVGILLILVGIAFPELWRKGSSHIGSLKFKKMKAG
ncbi:MULTISPECIES: EamA family transporter [Bacillaceae]|uniref:Drug/metabolite transporter (DMT)-like permease n=1 Tax=Peribacillus huizhouensis TaxID=1501239 RepID=A0ABR6CP92_9BACI|nr:MULTISPECIES: DMT family transporter [Bacillaceae]MBA9026830.1 drug/metabolite transporter (DMT)-like permease [Peribacillus huizhouensis]